MRLNNLFIHFLFAIIIFLLLDSFSYSQLQYWRYELPITISNNSGSQLNNYQLLMRINTKILINSGYMQSDGRDIRFASGCGSGLIDYCLENYINTDSTKIWIRISSLAPNTSQVVYLFMGNPSALPGSTMSLFEGPYSSTNQVMVTNTNINSNTQRGFRFTPNREILITRFGKRVPNATPRYVTLFDFNSHDIIAQLQVASGAPGEYNYSQLSNPIWLAAGKKYVMEVFQAQGDNYYFGVSSQIGPYLTYNDMRYQNNCDQNTFPTHTYSNFHYGVPDFMYYVRQTPVSPEPGYSAGLVADTNTPAPPVNLYAVGGNQQAILKWRKNTEFDMNSYYVFQNTVNDPYSSVQIGTTNHPDTVFTATGLNNTTVYYFWVKAADRYCSPRISGFSNVAILVPLGVINEEQIPREFKLYQNYPNPFNPVTDIKYDIPRETYVKLVVYDMLGREAAVLVNETKIPGTYNIHWGSDNIPSGIYIYKLTAGSYEKTMKMVLLK